MFRLTSLAIERYDNFLLPQLQVWEFWRERILCWRVFAVFGQSSEFDFVQPFKFLRCSLTKF
jgi:hypothetical protein